MIRWPKSHCFALNRFFISFFFLHFFSLPFVTILPNHVHNDSCHFVSLLLNVYLTFTLTFMKFRGLEMSWSRQSWNRHCFAWSILQTWPWNINQSCLLSPSFWLHTYGFPNTMVLAVLKGTHFNTVLQNLHSVCLTWWYQVFACHNLFWLHILFLYIWSLSLSLPTLNAHRLTTACIILFLHYVWICFSVGFINVWSCDCHGLHCLR